MTPEQYEDWLLQAQGKALPEASQCAPEPKPSPYRAAPLPDPMHANGVIWGARED